MLAFIAELERVLDVDYSIRYRALEGMTRFVDLHAINTCFPVHFLCRDQGPDHRPFAPGINLQIRALRHLAYDSCIALSQLQRNISSDSSQTQNIQLCGRGHRQQQVNYVVLAGITINNNFHILSCKDLINYGIIYLTSFGHAAGTSNQFGCRSCLSIRCRVDDSKRSGLVDRIANMGNLNTEDIKTCLQVLKESCSAKIQ